MNKFIKQIFLKDKHSRLFFEHKFHIHLSIYPIYQVNTTEWTAAIVALVVTRQNSTVAKSFLLNNTFSTLSKFLHQTCIVVLVQYLSHHSDHTRCIFDWTALVLSCLAQRKRMTECCSLRDAFNGNVAICNVHNWRHSDVIVIKLTAVTKE